MSDADLKSPQNPLKQAGIRAGINFTDERFVVDTIASHCLVEHAHHQGKGDALIEVLFKDYFEGGKDISDLGVLAQCADKVGVVGAAEALVDRPLIEKVYAIAEGWRIAHRISGVPYFVIRAADEQRTVALSGGQLPDVFMDAFQKVLE